MTRSTFSRRAIVTAVVALALTAGYTVTMYDVKHADPARRLDPKAPPMAGDRLSISATAYCKGQVTAAGVAVQKGSAASDRTLLPLGSLVEVRTGDARYDGLYTVLDTGPEIKGHELDIYMWSCNEALEFGRRQVDATLVRRGWDPQAVAARPPSLLDRILGRPVPVPVQAAAKRPSQKSGASPAGEPPVSPSVEDPPAPREPALTGLDDAEYQPAPPGSAALQTP